MVVEPGGDTSLEKWDGDCRLLAVKIDRAALENELARLLDAPVRSPVTLAPTIDITSGPGASWLHLARLMAADFRRYVGMPPMTYLRHLRLARVYEHLRQAEPALHSVTEIAYRYGFTHMGRFAAEYRARYGLLPSETLRA